jgi:vacuolar protein sorting-associated protein 54
VLKAPGTPTAVLETLVADKRAATAASSPPTSAASSPLSLPPTNIPLGSPRSNAPAPPTKRPSLFSNDRLKGMLSRSSTLPPASAPAPSPPPPVPAQEKQGGYKQVSALLSPTPLPVEKQRELPSSPVSVPIHATPSPTPTQVEEEERRESSTEALNGDRDHGASAAARAQAQAEHIRADVGGSESEEQGRDDAAEQRAPPTPAKDAVVRGRMTVPEPTPEGTSVAG